MIRTFKHRGLAAFWNKGDASKVKADLVTRVKFRLDALNSAQRPQDMKIPGFNFHPLKTKPLRYSVHVNGPWCITFAWEGNDAVDVALEQYH